MTDRNLLWVILAVTGLTLYITYRTGKGLEPVGEAVDKVKKNPLLQALGL